LSSLIVVITVCRAAMASTLMFMSLQLLPIPQAALPSTITQPTTLRAHNVLTQMASYTAVTITPQTVIITNSYHTDSYDKLTTRRKLLRVRLSFAPSACVDRLPSPNKFLALVLEGGPNSVGKALRGLLCCRPQPHSMYSTKVHMDLKALNPFKY